MQKRLVMKMKKSHRKRGKKGRERELAGDDTRKKEKRKEKKTHKEKI